MSRTAEQNGARLARIIFTAKVAELLSRHYGEENVIEGETNTGLCQLQVSIAPDITYNITITKARR